MDRGKKIVRMSSRLHMVADMITPGRVVADIGTDHGYIPIYQILTGKSPYAYACDVAEGPLLRARENVERYEVQDTVELVMSDGLAALKEVIRPAESIVIAGMGGNLMRRILENGEETAYAAEELILSPHSEICEVRRYLYAQGFHIIDENMIKEDGKFYTVMKARPNAKAEASGKQKAQEAGIPDEEGMLFGPLLMEGKHPVLKEFLEKELDTCKKILENLKSSGAAASAERYEEIRKRQKNVKNALEKITEV